MKRHHLLPLLLVAMLAACRSAGAPAAHTANLNQEVLLAPKEQVAYGPQGLTVEFVRVLEDSRCPKDVTCMWAGEVKVQVATRAGAAEPVQHEIKAGESAAVGAFQVWVVAVQPEKLTAGEIPAGDYRVTLKVEHRQP